ncbi:MAG: hypothetical protein KUG59_07685 [Parvibaculaceae bacterium]|nr:hypothetical protein [Parvibaculaceae bacterium]
MTEDATPSPSDKKEATSSTESSALPSQENSEPSHESNTDPAAAENTESQPTIEAAVSTVAEPTNTPKPRIDRSTEPRLERWQLVWDVVIFQGKLVLDGGRDLLLSPLSIIIAIYALITQTNAGPAIL